MEDAELVKKMLSNIESKKKKGSQNTEDLLAGIAETKTTPIKEAITEINDQIIFREKLHKEMIQGFENLKSTINNMMPSNPSIESQKLVIELQKKLIEVEEGKVSEKLNCFRDIADLKKELREWLREFRDKENRASLLGDLLTE